MIKKYIRHNQKSVVFIPMSALINWYPWTGSIANFLKRKKKPPLLNSFYPIFYSHLTKYLSDFFQQIYMQNKLPEIQTWNLYKLFFDISLTSESVTCADRFSLQTNHEMFHFIRWVRVIEKKRCFCKIKKR